MKIIDYCEDHCPDYALSHFVNADSSGMEDSDIEAADSWDTATRERLAAKYPGATIDLVFSDRKNCFNSSPAFGLACGTVPCAHVVMVANEDPRPAMQLPWELEWTPVIHASEIQSQEYIGVVEIENELESGELHVVAIETPHGAFMVAGGACNAGLLPSYAVAWDKDYWSTDEALQCLIEDIESMPYPSGELKTWHGSRVI